MQQCNSYWLLASTIETQQIIPWDLGGETHFIDLDKNLCVSTLVHLWQPLSLFLDFASQLNYSSHGLSICCYLQFMLWNGQR
jgi:hypothetical protein